MTVGNGKDIKMKHINRIFPDYFVLYNALPQNAKEKNLAVYQTCNMKKYEI